MGKDQLDEIVPMQNSVDMWWDGCVAYDLSVDLSSESQSHHTNTVRFVFCRVSKSNLRQVINEWANIMQWTCTHQQQQNHGGTFGFDMTLDAWW
jgi:hypothetical protein